MWRSVIKRLSFLLALPFLLACTQISPIQRERVTSADVDSLTAGYAEILSTGTGDAEEQGADALLSADDESITSQIFTNRIVVLLDKQDDPGLKLYRHPPTQDEVEQFYIKLTGSSEISVSILKSADQYEIPLSLAFSLAWVESGFSAQAVNSNPGSVDRGLFQLNSRSFPELKEADYFNPEINAEHGLRYLKRCIDVGGNEIIGLAMYNAGRTRVERGGTPIITLEYISKILEYREDLEREFEKTVLMKGIVLRKQPADRSVS